jgi:hypothetical protein
VIRRRHAVDRDEQIFNALLATGWDVKVEPSGDIYADRNQARIHGTIKNSGVVEWEGSLQSVEFVLRDARIQDFKQRAERHEASPAAADTRPNLWQ